MTPRYPVYVISKGRASATQCQTATFLSREGADFSLIVEPQERELYEAAGFGRYLKVLPFSNLGLGSIPARNWVWEDSIARGAERHWILDDNIRGTWRRWKARKIRCDSSLAFCSAERFVDRYENIAIAGLNYYMFAINREPQPPFYLNAHVYSCLLIRSDLAFRWRGRYNEDTDLCLQVLAAGWCTVLFNAFLAWKSPTLTMKGGNEELYRGDGRLKMARSLERVWPGVVETRRKFQRPQHVVKDNWGRFDTQLRLKPGVSLEALPAVDELGMELHQVKPEIKSPELRAMVSDRLVGPR